jgi:mannosyltransferase OCH1-like enzyme
MSIPKILHQLWIGPKTPPTTLMNTWKEKHEADGFEYIRWTEDELIKRGFKSQLKNRIDEMEEINGKADILRWEILYEYGGVFVDADCFCIEPVTDLVEKYKGFAGYENERVRGPGWAGKEYSDVLAHSHPLIATGTMAFPPKHDLPKKAIEWIKHNSVNVNKTGRRAWRTVGPGLLTRLFFSKKWDDITILPSYYFLPVHASGITYEGHSKIYAHQEWGSTKDSYHIMNNSTIPRQFQTPKDKVSILIPNYNTKAIYIQECLNSIKNQTGNIFLEIIWIDDGSSDINKKLSKRLLDNFIKTTRFTSLIYSENDSNMGLGYTLNRGVELCNNEIILRMDTDDIMHPYRITKQYEYINKNKDVVICGCQVLMFKNNINNIVNITNHGNHTLTKFKKNPTHWLMNHPTFCFKKSKIIEVGNYNNKTRNMIEDFELELKILNKYGTIYNMPDRLLYYRLHDEQVTHNGGEGGPDKWNKIRNDLIDKIINNN